MRLAHLTFTVRPEAQDEALGVLLAEVPAVREMAGCMAFIPFIDPTVTGGVGVVHEWATEEDFAAYLASPTFAASGAQLFPLMTGEPDSRRFDATLIDPAA
ncbi:MAG: antibiotic biosynthesis monooxygenase [Thermomicrobiales bacterium]